MTSIDFYFNAEDRLGVACRLTARALRDGLRILIWAPQAETAQQIDRMLWTWQAVSFLPHCHAGDALAGETPVWIGSEGAASASQDVLINLSAESPPFFARHERLLEIVTPDEAGRGAGRARYAFYRDRGYAIRNHDLAATGNA